jgi:hypothetical protein
MSRPTSIARARTRRRAACGNPAGGRLLPSHWCVSSLNHQPLKPSALRPAASFFG